MAHPREGNERFEVVVVDPITIALRDGRGCYAAFDQNGELVPPCNVTMEDYRTHLILKTYVRQ